MKLTENVIANIKYTAKLKGIKYGDLERSAGMSVGYLSKCLGKGCKLTLDDVSAIAIILEVPEKVLLSERKAPHWIKKYDRDKSWTYICSECMGECYSVNGINYKYCPHCRTEMERTKTDKGEIKNG